MRRCAAVLCALLLAAGPAAAQTQSILQNFQPNATGYSEDNAYALAYLSTMVYAQNLAFELVGTDQTALRDSLERDPVQFMTTFMQQVSPLLGEAADYTYVRACSPTGFDPEAMVIKTSKAVFVVFRGTDRVGCGSSDGTLMGDVVSNTEYGAAEWISTDFDIRRVPFTFPVSTNRKVGEGLVHRGIWYSLASVQPSFKITRQQLLGVTAGLRVPIMATPRLNLGGLTLSQTLPTSRYHGIRLADLPARLTSLRQDQPFIQTLEDVVKGYTSGADSTKKIWVTGHSLGGAHCQLAAMFLKKRGYKVQGVYGFAGPDVGTTELAHDLEATFPGAALTRFVFAVDPIPSLANPQVGFASAGRIVHYEDLTTRRIVNDDTQIVSGAGALLNAIVGGVSSQSFVHVQSGLETMCFHYPQWYLHAAFEDLCRAKPTRLGAVRAPTPPVPDMRRVGGNYIFDPCTRSLLQRGAKKSLVDNAREDLQAGASAGVDALLNFAYDAVFAIGNEIGNKAFEGVYTIESYASHRWAAAEGTSSKFVDRDGDVVNLSATGSDQSDNEFEIRLSGIGGYVIGRSGSSKLLTPKAEGLDLFANNFEYEMREPEMVLPDCPWNDPLCGDTRRIPSIEQTWHLYQLKEAADLFLIENRLGGKVLDANDACSVQDVKDCKIKQFSRGTNDATQLWVLRRKHGI